MAPLELAEVMVASWVLGGAEQPMPAAAGWLDRSLHGAVQAGAFGIYAKKLRFIETALGLRCAEADAIVEWAQRAQLLGAPRPGQRAAEVRVGPKLARRILKERGIQEEEATAWGRRLRQAAHIAERELQNFAAPIEEY
jgi:hypothetical protein